MILWDFVGFRYVTCGFDGPTRLTTFVSIDFTRSNGF